MNKILFVISMVVSASFFSTTASAVVICFEDGTCYEIGDPSTHP
ncbi:hypothetical protein [Buttiauxella ferragutiae]|nr:hypothetical protein [Buttiauxella ferragutiae]